VKCRLLLPDCNETWNFLDLSLKNTQVLNFMTIRLVGAKFLVVEGQAW